MKRYINFLKKILILIRIKDGLFATRYFNKKYLQIIKWMFTSKEDTSFTYDLEDKNLNFSMINKRNFVLFKEKPKNHWYPGAGIGISYLK